jgi:hypothetical protein
MLIIDYGAPVASQERAMNIRMIPSFLKRFAYVCVFLCMSLNIRLAAQLGSVAQTPQAVEPIAFQVNSATYVPKTDNIVVELINSGKRPVTAYQLDITVTNGGKEIKHERYSKDLIEVVLNKRLVVGSDASWDGAIKPGDTYTETFTASLSGTSLPGPGNDTKVQAVITGVTWSDGATNSTDTRAAVSMNRYLTIRNVKARTESAILSIFEGHKADVDVQHRLEGISRDINALKLKSQENKNKQLSAMTDVMDQPEIYMVEQNLAAIRNVADSAAALDAYCAYYLSHHSHRVALVQPVPAQLQTER